MTLANEILADSPIGYYKLDETAGTTASDSSPHLRHAVYSDAAMVGTGTAPPAVGGVCPTWLGGSGSGRRVELPSSSIWALPTVGSFDMLVYLDPARTDRTESRLIEHEASGTDSSGDNARQVNVTNRILSCRRNNTSNNDVDVGGCNLRGRWLHFAATWDTGRTDKMRGFLNGHRLDVENTFGGFDALTTSPWIGAPRRTSWDMHHGHMAHVAFYDTALADERIAAHAAAAGLTRRPCVGGPTVGYVGPGLVA